jgi:hypothetical protein
MELTKDVKADLKLHKKLVVLEYAKQSEPVAKALMKFNVPKATYYKWKEIFNKDSTKGVLKNHPVAYDHPNEIKEDVIEKESFKTPTPLL